MAGNYIERADTLPDSSNKSDFYQLLDGARVKALADGDTDTKIQVEESSDEDIIRFDCVGAEQITIQDGKIEPSVDNDIDLGSSGKEFKDLHIDGTANIDTLVADTADINAGTVDATIGGTTPAVGKFTTLEVTGGQIKFPASQSASGDANTLDDYEEGTFTMVLSFGGGSTSIVYTNQEGFYTKVGNIVHCSGRLQISNKGSSNGGAVIGGLPFTVVNNLAGTAAVSLKVGNVVFANMPNSVVSINTDEISIGELSDGGVNSALLDTDFSNNSIIDMQVTYRVA